MTTDVQLLRGGSFTDIPFTDFSIELGISTQKTVPEAQFTTLATEAVTAGQEARIVIDGVTRFKGITANSGRKEQGQQTVELTHNASELFSAEATFTETGPPTDEDVLLAAVSNAQTNQSFTLDYNATAVVLDNKYEANGRGVKQIFQDMMDRTDYIWWTDPVNNTVHVDEKGGRGLWQSLDTEADPGVEVRRFDEGNIATVRNAVTVIGTGGLAQSATRTDSTSISEYGRRSAAYQVDYAITQEAADNIALSLLQPNPIPEGEVAVSQNVGAVDAPRVNQTIDLEDSAQDISANSLLVERQTIEQGRATLSAGGGAGATVEDVNRTAKSEGDVTRPGSVYDTDRIADDAIETAKIVDLSISETKIQDDAISTPKLQANSVSANEIETNTITAAEIDVLDLDTNQLTIGNQNVNFEFDIDSSGATDIVEMIPSGPFDGFVGTDVTPLGNLYSENANLGEIRPYDGDGTGFIGRSFETWNEIWGNKVYGAAGGNVSGRIVIREDGGQNLVVPTDDAGGSLGTDTKSFNNVWAFNYLDANDGECVVGSVDAAVSGHRRRRRPDRRRQWCRSRDRQPRGHDERRVPGPSGRRGN